MCCKTLRLIFLPSNYCILVPFIYIPVSPFHLAFPASNNHSCSHYSHEFDFLKVLPFHIHRLISSIKKTDDKINRTLCSDRSHIGCRKQHVVKKKRLRGSLLLAGLLNRMFIALKKVMSDKEVSGIPIWDLLVYIFRRPTTRC